ncbi:conserved hypothetical protein [Neospora caninum Liverpool]|uniref:Post-SET domain-containing protein n=1 Tax=Neospora caninum (strain Liverpool) TaxID=572307 RepID=F0VAI9_NEOCL|nr:conserved hypothetical protein [Neospora caninum Liverpool]CBZ50678.1 conserved hypothetical protein [Neospora caninum Liverpool]|eukprot:XP_003880711.1 conserved hypothetical protein [Neospora caninum Liverpool]
MMTRFRCYCGAAYCLFYLARLSSGGARSFCHFGLFGILLCQLVSSASLPTEHARHPAGAAAPLPTAAAPPVAAHAASHEAGDRRVSPPSASAKSGDPLRGSSQRHVPASVQSRWRPIQQFPPPRDGQHTYGAFFAPPPRAGSDPLLPLDEPEKTTKTEASSDFVEILVRSVDMTHGSALVGTTRVQLPLNRLRPGRSLENKASPAEEKGGEERDEEEERDSQTGEGGVSDSTAAGHSKSQFPDDGAEPREGIEEETGEEVVAAEYARLKIDISHFSLPREAVFFFRWGKPPTFVNYDLRLEVKSPGMYFLPLVRAVDGISSLQHSVECASPSSLSSSQSCSSPSSSSSSASSSSSLQSTGRGIDPSLSSLPGLRSCTCSHRPFSSSPFASPSAGSAFSSSASGSASAPVFSSFLPFGRLYYLILSCTVDEFAAYRQKLAPRSRDATLAGTVSLSFHGEKFLRILPFLTQDERVNMDFTSDPGNNRNVHFFHLPAAVPSRASSLPLSPDAAAAEEGADLFLAGLPGPLPAELGAAPRRRNDPKNGGDASEKAGQASETLETSQISVGMPQSDNEVARRRAVPEKLDWEGPRGPEAFLSWSGDLKAAEERIPDKGIEAKNKHVEDAFTRFFFFAPKTLLEDQLTEEVEGEGSLEEVHDQNSRSASSPSSSSLLRQRKRPHAFRSRLFRPLVVPSSTRLKAAPSFSFEWHQVVSLLPKALASLSSLPARPPGLSSPLASHAVFSPVACVRVQFSGPPSSLPQRENGATTDAATALDTCAFFDAAVHGGSVPASPGEPGDLVRSEPMHAHAAKAEGLGARRGAGERAFDAGGGDDEGSTAQGGARRGAEPSGPPEWLQANAGGGREDFVSVPAALARFFNLRSIDMPTQRSTAAQAGKGKFWGEKGSSPALQRQTREWTFSVPRENLPVAMRKAAYVASLSWRLVPLLLAQSAASSAASVGGAGPGRDEKAKETESAESGSGEETDNASRETGSAWQEGLQRRELRGDAGGGPEGDRAAKHLAVVQAEADQGKERTEIKAREKDTPDREEAAGSVEETQGEMTEIFGPSLFLLSQRVTLDLPARGPWAFSFYLNTTMPIDSALRWLACESATQCDSLGENPSFPAFPPSASSPPSSASSASDRGFAGARQPATFPAFRVQGEPSSETFSKVPFFIRRHSCRAALHAPQRREAEAREGGGRERASSVPVRLGSSVSGETGEAGEVEGDRENTAVQTEESPSSGLPFPALFRFPPFFSLISPFLSFLSRVSSRYSLDAASEEALSFQGQDKRSRQPADALSPGSHLSHLPPSRPVCTSCGGRSSLLSLPLLSPNPSSSFLSFLLLSSLASNPASRSPPSTASCGMWCTTPILSFSRPSLPIFQPNLLQSVSLSLGPESEETPVLAALSFAPSEVSGGVAALLILDAGDIWRSPKFVCEEADWEQENQHSAAEPGDARSAAARGSPESNEAWNKKGRTETQAGRRGGGEEARRAAKRDGESGEAEGGAWRESMRNVGDQTVHFGRSDDDEGQPAAGGEAARTKTEEMQETQRGVDDTSLRRRVLSSEHWAKGDWQRRVSFASPNPEEAFERETPAPVSGLVNGDLEPKKAGAERAGSRRLLSSGSDVVVSFTVEFLLRREAAPFRGPSLARTDGTEAAGGTERARRSFDVQSGSATGTVIAHSWLLPFTCRNAGPDGERRVGAEPRLETERGQVHGRDGRGHGAREEPRRGSSGASPGATGSPEGEGEAGGAQGGVDLPGVETANSARTLDTRSERSAAARSAGSRASTSSVVSMSLSLESAIGSSSFASPSSVAESSPGFPSRRFSVAKKVGASEAFLYEATVPPSWNFLPGRHLASWRLVQRAVVVSPRGARRLQASSSFLPPDDGAAGDRSRGEINGGAVGAAKVGERRDKLQLREDRNALSDHAFLPRQKAQSTRLGGEQPGVRLTMQILADEPCEQTCHRGHCWPLGFVDGFRLSYCRCTLGVGGAACDVELLPRWYVSFLTGLLVLSNSAFLFVLHSSMRELADAASLSAPKSASDRRPAARALQAGAGGQGETLSTAMWRAPAALRAAVRVCVFGAAMAASSMYHLCFDGDRCFVVSPLLWQKLDFLFSFLAILLVVVALFRLPPCLEFLLLGISFAVIFRAFSTPHASAMVSHLFVCLGLLLLLRTVGTFPRLWMQRRRQRGRMLPGAWECRQRLLTAIARAIEDARENRRRRTEGPEAAIGSAEAWGRERGSGPQRCGHWKTQGVNEMNSASTRREKKGGHRELEQADAARREEADENGEGDASLHTREFSFLRGCLQFCRDFAAVLGTQVAAGVADPVSLLVGIFFALVGACAFVFFETNGNYAFVHSLWHVSIELSPFFCLRGLAASRADPVLAEVKAPREKRQKGTGGEAASKDRQNGTHELRGENEGGERALGAENETERRQAPVEPPGETRPEETFTRQGEAQQAGRPQCRFVLLRRLQAAASHAFGSEREDARNAIAETSDVCWEAILSKALAESAETELPLETGAGDEDGSEGEETTASWRRMVTVEGEGTGDEEARRFAASKGANDLRTVGNVDSVETERDHLVGESILVSTNVGRRTRCLEARGTPPAGPSPSSNRPAVKGCRGDRVDADSLGNEPAGRAPWPSAEFRSDLVAPLAFLLSRQQEAHRHATPRIVFGRECLWCAMAGRLSAFDVAKIQGEIVRLRVKKVVRQLVGKVCF